MNYIGIDVHKSICTAVVMNDDEKVIDQIIDFGTNDEGCSFIVDHYSPEDSYILFENLTPPTGCTISSRTEGTVWRVSTRDTDV